MSDPRDDRRIQRIQDKGWEVAQRIAKIKAGENVRIADMMGLRDGPVGQTKEEKLRAWLDAINRARDRFHGGDFGRCLDCAGSIRAEVLDETPWTELCGECDAP